MGKQDREGSEDAVKHPGPWFLDSMRLLMDDNDDVFARVETDDPETRVILTRAAEMWEAIQEVASVGIDTPAYRTADKKLCLLANKINAEIAAAKGVGT